jgi:quercetin dioxygenase-like cupin family protein
VRATQGWLSTINRASSAPASSGITGGSLSPAGATVRHVSRETRFVVARESEREWESWPEGELAARGRVFWKTLFSRGITPTEALMLGIARIAPGEALHEHRHAEPEIYLVLAGVATVVVDDRESRIEAGAAIFIPGDAVHGCRNAEASELRFAYVFPTDSFEDVEYVFGDGRGPTGAYGPEAEAASALARTTHGGSDRLDDPLAPA